MTAGEATVDCQLLRCGRSESPHFLPYPKGDENLPRCPFDGTEMTVDEPDTWCVRDVWDDVVRLFAGRGEVRSDVD